MKKKINKSKVLFVLLLFTGIVYGISILFSEKKEPPFEFEADLIQVDTHSISSIHLFLKAEHFEKISLQKEPSDWLVTKNNFTTKANSDRISQLLSTIHLIKTDKIVANQADKWKQFGVDRQKSNQVQIYTNGVLQEDFFISTISFSRSRPDTAYIRLANENEVYAIHSSISKNIDNGFDSFRNKNVLNVHSNQLTQLEVFNRTSFDTIIRQENRWVWDKTVLDSLAITNYINDLAKVSGTSFVDDFDEMNNEKLLSHQLKLTCKNQPESILIRCYTDTLRAKPYIIHSNMNKDAYFASDSSGIYQRLFKNVSDFIK